MAKELSVIDTVVKQIHVAVIPRTHSSTAASAAGCALRANGAPQQDILMVFVVSIAPPMYVQHARFRVSQLETVCD